MKKLIAMMLCILMVLSLVACSGDEKEPTETTTESTTEPTTEPTTEATTTEEPITEEITEEIVESMDSEFDPFAPTELTAFVEGLYKGYTAELPSLVTRTIIPEDFEYYVATPYVEGMEAALSEPMIGSIAHAVIVLKVPEGTDAEAVRADIEANANPRRWQCVEAEKVAVVASGDTILFAMCGADLANVLVDNFNAKMAE